MTETIERHLAALVADDLEDIDAVFINGARQSGKSTFVESFGSRYKKVFYASFDDIALRTAELAAPGSTFADIDKGLVILDEIQLVPDSFLALKAKIDESRKKRQKVQFLLTGSADIMLFPQLSNALVGRMYVRTMHPFSAAEIMGTPGAFVKNLFKSPPPAGQVFSKPLISKIIPRASFPKPSLAVKNRNAWYQSYISTLLDRDIKQLSEIDRMDIMPRLLSVLANRAGGLLNDADLAAAVKISQPTVKRYRTLLDGVFLSFQLPPWFKKLEKRFVKSPKVYFRDTMLLCNMLGMPPEEIEKRRHESFGFILENFVASELAKQLSLMNDGTLYHFRTSDQKEIDFLIERRNGELFAIEVKASAVVVAGDFKHIRFLAESLPQNFVRGIVLYQGSTVIRFDKNLYAVPLSALWEM